MKKQKIEKVPHPALVYSSTATAGVVGAKSHEKISPIHGEKFRAGEVIRFEIPAKGYLDPDELCIEFRTKIFPGPDNSQFLAADEPNTFVRIDRGVRPRAEHRLKMCQFVPGIQSIFSRVRLLSGQTVLEDIQEYNVLYRMLLDCTTSREWRATEGFMNEGVYDPNVYTQRVDSANWHAYSTATDNGPPSGHVYLVKPLLGLFAAGKFLPVKYMHALTLELYLAQNQECLWSSSSIDASATLDGTPRQVFHHTSTDNYFQESGPYSESALYRIPSKETPTSALDHLAVADSSLIKTDFPSAYYELDNCYIHTTTVYPEESFDHSLKSQISGGMVHFRHSTWSTHLKRIQSCEKTSVGFQERVHSLKGVLACMRNSPTIDAIDTDFCFPANGIQRYQWRIGSELLPTQPVECGEGPGLALAELKKALGLRGPDSQLKADYLTEKNFLPRDLPHQLDSANFSELNRGTSQPSSFYMAIDTEKSRGQVSGFDTASNSNDIELLLDLRPHESLVPATITNDVPPLYFNATPDTRGSDRRFKGAVQGTANFQPSKKRVIITQQIPYTLGEAGAYPQHNYQWGDQFIWNSNDTVSDLAAGAGNIRRPEMRSHSGACEGMMTDVGVTYVVEAKPRVWPVTLPYVDAEFHAKYSVLSKGQQFALVYLFAHVDQVLILDSFGTSKVVR